MVTRGAAEVAEGIRRLVAGDPRAQLGLDLGAVARSEAEAALTDVWGWDAGRPRSALDPDRTLTAARALGARLHEAAAGGESVAFATARPASLLPALARLAAAARSGGAVVADVGAFGPVDPDRHPRRWIWWHAGVAVVSDGEQLLADGSVEAADEWLFAVGRPGLVVADHAFAGVAARAGLDTWALADLDAPALAVAAGRGSLRIVPIEDRCPPVAYGPLVEAALHEDQEPHSTGDPHSTTGVDGAYAPAD